MKKSIIAAGAASVALAAMPIVGVFAASGDPIESHSVNDVVRASIQSGCSASDSVVNKNVNLTVAPGTLAETTAAGSISIICTGGINWNITAVGAGETGHETTLYDGTNDIATNANTTSGTTSAWAFKASSITNNADPETPITVNGTNGTSWQAIPAATSPVTLQSGNAAANLTLNTQYRVYAALSQNPGTYAGKVTYTIAGTEI